MDYCNIEEFINFTSTCKYLHNYRKHYNHIIEAKKLSFIALRVYRKSSDKDKKKIIKFTCDG